MSSALGVLPLLCIKRQVGAMWLPVFNALAGGEPFSFFHFSFFNFQLFSFFKPHSCLAVFHGTRWYFFFFPPFPTPPLHNSRDGMSVRTPSPPSHFFSLLFFLSLFFSLSFFVTRVFSQKREQFHMIQKIKLGADLYICHKHAKKKKKMKDIYAKKKKKMEDIYAKNKA